MSSHTSESTRWGMVPLVEMAIAAIPISFSRGTGGVGAVGAGRLRTPARLGFASGIALGNNERGGSPASRKAKSNLANKARNDACMSSG